MIKRKYIVADAILDTLKAHWVTTMFGYPWWAILPFYDVLPFHNDIKHILVRNEQWAAFAAQWWARSTKTLWVCCATSWPWATNLITWIADAYLDSIPILCITWQVPLWMIGKDMFQEVDMTWITLNITKHNYLISDAKDVVNIVSEAIAIAMSGRPWPVHIDVPKDIMASEHPSKFDIPKIDLSSRDPMQKAYEPIWIDIIDNVVKLLKSSKKPILLVWQWVKHSWAEKELNEFIEKIWIPTASTLLWKWIVNFDNKNYLWMIWMHWFYHANMAMHHADLILNIWSRFDDRIVWTYKTFWKDAKIIHVDIDKSEINKVIRTDISINSDALQFIWEILSYPNLNKLEINNWNKQIKEWENKHPYEKESKWFAIKDALNLLMEHINLDLDNNIILTDVWQHQMWSALSCEVSNSKNWLSSWWAWTMWFALPTSIWAAIANPEKNIICIAWDWWIQMNIQELQTIIDHNLNIKICILNNNFLWMVRQWQELFYWKNYSQVLISSPDFIKLAHAYWIEWHRIKWKKDFWLIASKIFNKKWPQLIEFIVEQESNVFPMVPWWNCLWDVLIE